MRPGVTAEKLIKNTARENRCRVGFLGRGSWGHYSFSHGNSHYLSLNMH